MTAGVEALTGPHLWRGQAGCSALNVRATGFDALDQALGGGWPWGAVIEIFVERYGSGELSLLMPSLALLSANEEAESGLFVFVSPPWVPYPPALIRHGIDVGRVLVAQPSRAMKEETLWATEQAVRSGASSAVLAWLGSANDTVLRRLQLSAEERGCGLVLFRPGRAIQHRSPAALRLKVSIDRDETRVDVLKRRGGGPQSIRLDILGRSRFKPVMLQATRSRLLKKPVVDAMQGGNRLESAAYTGVREHFEPVSNAAARRHGLFQQPARRS